MLACDQLRIPPGRSIRLTSSAVNGAYLARHVQKSSASFSSESGCAWAIAEIASEVSSKSGTKRRKHSKSLCETKHPRFISREALLECDVSPHRFPLSHVSSDSVFTPSGGATHWRNGS